MANSSIRKLLIPREHGSWALWIMPMISAAIVAESSAAARDRSFTSLLLFALMSALAFMVYQPLEELMGLSIFKLRTGEEKRAAVLWIAAFSAAALAVFLFLVLEMRRQGLLWPAALVAVCFGVRAALGMDRRFRVLKELIGSLALSSTAVGAYYCAAGLLNKDALGLWIASWLFAVGQIEYVQMRIHAGNAGFRDTRFLRVLAFHLFLPLAAFAAWRIHLAPPWTAVVFLPGIVRILVWRVSPPVKLNVRRLGVAELLLGIAFGLMLAVAYLWA
jgi:hypothetical protein